MPTSSSSCSARPIVAAALAAGMLAGAPDAASASASASAGRPEARTAGPALPGGISVAALQRALGVPADGTYGPRTRRAVRRLQRRHGLTADGIAGPRTLAALGLRARPAATAPPPAGVAATLARIAACESGGNPAAVSADGRYRGKYQFSRATWRAMGGAGDPATASELEQDRRAAALLAARGTAPWPSCAG